MARTARRREFDYKPPSFEDTVERADRQGSMYDNLFKGIKTFKPVEGRNIVRILPPTWPKATHYGFPIWVHYNVGPKEAAYLCLRENKTSPHKHCPLCDELYTLGAKATTEDRKALLPTQSIIYYILDRNQPQNGVMLWRVSGTADSEIAAQSVNRRKGSVLNIVDPDRGYDLEFLRAGQKLATRYRGYQVVREDSPMTDDGRQFDEVLDYIFDNPLPDVLNFYKPEHIDQVYSGKMTDDDEDDSRDRDRDRDRGRGSRVRDDDDNDVDLSPLRRRREEEDAPAPRMRSRAAAPPPPDDDDDDPEATRAVERPRRTRLAREIDDDIPEQPRGSTRGSRVQVEDDDDDGPPFDPEPANGRERSRSRGRDDDDDVDDRRTRMRDRLRRRD
jgi:hypothetical protein